MDAAAGDEAFELREQGQDGFRDGVWELLNQASGMTRGTAVIDAQALFVGDDGGPDIVSSQSAMDVPGFVEQGDVTVFVDVANEVHSSLGNGQRVRQSGNVGIG